MCVTEPSRSPSTNISDRARSSRSPISTAVPLPPARARPCSTCSAAASGSPWYQRHRPSSRWTVARVSASLDSTCASSPSAAAYRPATMSARAARRRRASAASGSAGAGRELEVLGPFRGRGGGREGGEGRAMSGGSVAGGFVMARRQAASPTRAASSRWTPAGHRAEMVSATASASRRWRISSSPAAVPHDQPAGEQARRGPRPTTAPGSGRSATTIRRSRPRRQDRAGRDGLPRRPGGIPSRCPRGRARSGAGDCRPRSRRSAGWRSRQVGRRSFTSRVAGVGGQGFDVEAHQLHRSGRPSSRERGAGRWATTTELRPTRAATTISVSRRPTGGRR